MPDPSTVCGWEGESAEYTCVKPAGHTGNHHTVRKDKQLDADTIELLHEITRGDYRSRDV